MNPRGVKALKVVKTKASVYATLTNDAAVAFAAKLLIATSGGRQVRLWIHPSRYLYAVKVSKKGGAK